MLALNMAMVFNWILFLSMYIAGVESWIEQVEFENPKKLGRQCKVGCW